METSKGRGSGQNKRFWSEEEDNKLIESLVELNNEGRFKSKGSFKSGHMRELEKKLHEKLHECDLMARPHIESRMKTLKTNFHIVHDMLTGPNYSGFGWDSERKTVTAEKHVCDAYLQAAPFKIKSFPYYEDFSMIFSKDRATGQHAETPVDVEEQLQNKGEDYPGEDADFNSSDNMKNVSDNNVDDQFVSPTPKWSQSQSDCSSKYKKQNKCKSTGDLADTIKESTLALAAVIEKSSACLSKAMVEDMNEKHMKLGKELSKTTTLSIMECHKFFKLIVQDNAMVSYFFSLPDELKDDWVTGMLAGTI
ncbi:hypothetical protein UlMin_027506 [Ulmus minor]